MKQKRGFLLAEETLKIILAVVAITFLAYLLFSIYQSNKTSNELELARESLNHVFSELDVKRQNIEIYNPKGWFITSWNSFGERPISCSSPGWESCICICDDKLFRSDVNSCDGAGACRENQEFFSLEKTKIENPPAILNIDYETKMIREGEDGS